MDKENIHKGHRARMRGKLYQYGDRVFHTYELLEMLLYHVVSYKNTNSEAKRLVAKFGSIEGVFSASREQLMSVEGVGPKIADLIISVSALNLSDTGETKSKPRARTDTECDYKTVGEYVTDYFKGRSHYSVIAILFDNRMGLIGTEEVFLHHFSSGAVRSAPFIDVAVRHGASVIIIAHNHPYGPIFPSEGDIVTNHMIETDLERAGITLAEHYLVSGDKYVGFMNNSPASAFSQTSPLARFILSKEAYNATDV